MSRLWVICGAGRGVGKTTLAQNLCHILPAAVYAKQGHGQPQVSKHPNFFRTLSELQSFIDASSRSHQHIIVESNPLARQDQADIVIFIDGRAGKTSFRPDTARLRAAADIVIAVGSRPADWQKTLQTKLKTNNLAKEVCNILSVQKRFLLGRGPQVCSKVWIEIDGARVFGSGLAQLLANVDSLGTLQQAARTTGMSYRYAWNLLSVAERRLGKKLILRRPGGLGGGKSALSSTGRQMLEIFNRLNAEVATFADRCFLELYHRQKANSPKRKV